MKFRLSEHAREVITKREIKFEWLETALFKPDRTEVDKFDSELEHRLARISEFGNRILRVILKRDTDPVFIITVFFDRRIRSTK